jgi:hypothetical protein
MKAFNNATHPDDNQSVRHEILSADERSALSANWIFQAFPLHDLPPGLPRILDGESMVSNKTPTMAFFLAQKDSNYAVTDLSDIGPQSTGKSLFIRELNDIRADFAAKKVGNAPKPAELSA